MVMRTWRAGGDEETQDSPFRPLLGLSHSFGSPASCERHVVQLRRHGHRQVKAVFILGCRLV
jgi:hypothetical protein